MGQAPDGQPLTTGTPDLLASLDEHVLTLTLNRPDARNAMSRAMNIALQQQLAEAEINPAVRCIVLTGAGSGFCAGGDVKSPSSSDGDREDRALTLLTKDCQIRSLATALPT